MSSHAIHEAVVIPEHAVLILEERLKEWEAEGVAIPPDWGREEFAVLLLLINEGLSRTRPRL